MKTIIKIFAVAALSLTACGDNLKATNDGATGDTGSNGSNFPAAPTLGSQIDRMGRPTINTALNHAFDPNGSAAGSSKDAYNMDESVGTWTTTWTPVLIQALPLLDAVDTGYCGNGVCETTVAGESVLTCTADCGSGSAALNIGLDGCGNQAFYDASKNNVTAYGPLAFVLADDELYLETSKSTCAGYLAVEFFTQVLQLSVSSTCGGRAPSYDVIDTTYTLATFGVAGFDKTTFAPVFGDKVAAHTDISDSTFPFLGAPHNQ